jgi:hypothetical protein
MESAQVALLEMRSEEILRREEYMSRSGRYLPPFFLRVVPSLRMKPLLTQRETLPLLSSPQQQEEKVSQLQSQSQPQEGEAGEDEEKESQESQGKAGESPTKSEVRPNLEELLRNVLLERRDEIRELVSRYCLYSRFPTDLPPLLEMHPCVMRFLLCSSLNKLLHQ